MTRLSAGQRRLLAVVFWVFLFGSGYGFYRGGSWLWLGLLGLTVGTIYLYRSEGKPGTASPARRLLAASMLPVLFIGVAAAGRLVDAGAPDWVGMAVSSLLFIVPLSVLAAMRFGEEKRASESA